MALLRFTDERPDAAIRKAISATIADAESNFAPLRFEGEYPVSGIGISELRPHHVENTTTNLPQYSNLNIWQTSCCISSTWADWINVTVDKDTYIVVTGIFTLDSAPVTTEIAPSANGLDLPIINIEQMYGLDVATVWFSKPFVVKPDNNITLQLYSALTVANPSQKIGLLGYAIAKRAKLIDKS